MLERVNVSPSVLSAIPTDEYARKLYCNSILAMMNDVLWSGVLIIDEHRHMLEEYRNAIAGWPVKFRKPLQELLVVLIKRNRFVRLQSSSTVRRCEHSFHCAAIEVGLAGIPSVFNQVCSECMSEHLDGLAEAAEVSEYSLSSMHRRLRSCTSLVLANGEMDRAQFELKVLIPLLQDAKHLKIYDRYIGRAVKTKSRGRPVVNVRLDLKYAATLEWIISVFLQHSRPTRARVVEVYGGIESSICGPADKARVKSAFTDFERHMLTKYGFAVATFLKEEKSFANMSHARYILTDQVTLFLDRGMDLLWGDSEMQNAGQHPDLHVRRVRDVAIAHCSDASRVTDCVARLTNA